MESPRSGAIEFGENGTDEPYLFLATFNAEGNAIVKAIRERIANLETSYERFGDRIVEAHGAVGEFDMVAFEAPDLAAIKRTAMVGKMPGMVDLKLVPLIPMDDYRALIESL